MERLRWTSFIVLSTVLALVMQLLIINPVTAQAPNTSLAQNNNTLRIVDLENKTVSIIDPITDQVVRVENLTEKELSDILKSEKTTINETLTTNAGNGTTNVNLTTKFNTLQGK